MQEMQSNEDPVFEQDVYGMLEAMRTSKTIEEDRNKE